MKILIYVGYQKESVNKDYWLTKGMGGSEYCVMKLSEQFAQNGHDVTITGGITDQDVDGVKYRSIESFINSGENYFDIVISTNYIHYIQMLEDFGINYEKSYFWIHNEEFYTWYNGVELPNEGLDYLNHDKLDKIIAVSEWQKNVLVEKYSLEPSKVSVIGNAITPSDFDNIEQEKYNNKIIYTSSPDRGLVDLLDIWPKLKKINPELTLWIASPPYTKDWDLSVLESLPSDVRWLGHLPPSELYKQIKSSEYWIYPSTYDETYCITALEMMMGRVKLISTDTANLKTLLDGKCSLIRSDLSNSLMKETIISSYVFLRENEQVAQKYLNVGEQFAREQTWEVRYKEWMDVMEGYSEETERLHPELYDSWNNKEEWVNKFITYSARTKEWDLIVDEPFDNCFSFPLFTPEFCKMIREEAEHSDSWTVDRHENYPTTDMVLQTIGMHDIYMEVLKEYVIPLSILYGNWKVKVGIL